MTVDATPLCESGLSYPLAIEIARQLKARVGNADMLSRNGLNAGPAIELARQINANSFSASLLVAAMWNPVTAVAVALFATQWYVPYVINLTPANTVNFRTAYRAGAGNAIAAFTGDSTMRGVDSSANPVNTQYPNAMPMQLAAALNAAGMPAGANNWFGLSGTSLSDYTTRDSRVSVGGGTVLGSNKVQGGTEVRFPGVASTFSFTPPGIIDTVEIYWGDQGATGRTFSCQIDSGTANNIATSGTNQIARTKFTTTKGNHSVNLAWVSGGTTTIYGINCYDSTRNEISCWQMGISGGVTANMIDDGGTPGAGRLTQLTDFKPHCMFSECGIVNDWRSSVAVATSQANMDAYCADCLAMGMDFVFVVPPWDGGTSVAVQQPYVTAMYAVATKYNVPIIDIRLKWGSWANAVASGFQYVTDNVHPTKAGYIDQASVYLNVLQAMT